MADTIIRLTNAPSYQRASRLSDMTSQDSIRTYRGSPESITVQIRFTGAYANAHLTFAEARQFAEAILAEIPGGNGG